MVEIVPQVKQGTAFIFVDDPLGDHVWTGCALALRVLYDTQGIRCAHLSTFDPVFSATRFEDGFKAETGGLFTDENWIIIGTTEDAARFIIPELNPSDDVLIE